jgi:riboflavin biosynthesis pyrimidine reductase
LPGQTYVECPLHDGGVALPEVLGHLRERGLRQIVVEGGKALISQFLDEGLLDEVCITQAPYFGPDAAPALPASTRETRFRRELLLADEYGYLYQRLVADGA